MTQTTPQSHTRIRPRLRRCTVDLTPHTRRAGVLLLPCGPLTRGTLVRSVQRITYPGTLPVWRVEYATAGATAATWRTIDVDAHPLVTYLVTEQDRSVAASAEGPGWVLTSDAAEAQVEFAFGRLDVVAVMSRRPSVLEARLVAALGTRGRK